MKLLIIKSRDSGWPKTAIVGENIQTQWFDTEEQAVAVAKSICGPKSFYIEDEGSVFSYALADIDEAEAQRHSHNHGLSDEEVQEEREYWK